MYHVLVDHNSIENLAVKMLSNEIKLCTLAVSVNASTADSSFSVSISFASARENTEGSGVCINKL